MNQQGVSIAFLLFLFLICLTSAWDGLIKRNVRLFTRGKIDLNINFLGLPAQLVGVLDALFALILGKIGADGFIDLADKCNQGAACIFRGAIIPPFTDWISIAMLFFTAAYLIGWILTTFSQPGPCRRSFLAPGVWYREVDLIAEVQQNLERSHPTDIDASTLLWVVNWVRRQLELGYVCSRSALTTSIHKEWAEDLSRKAHVWRGFSENKAALRKTIQVTIQYYLERNEEANRVWPWRKRLGW